MLCHADNLVTNSMSRSATLGILPSEQASIQGLPGLHLTLQKSPKQRVQCKRNLTWPAFFLIGLNWPHYFQPFAS